MRAKQWATWFVDVCHREMLPLRAGLGGRERIAILYERPLKGSGRDYQSTERSCPRRPSVDTSLLVRIAIIIGLAMVAAGCAHALSLPPQVTVSEVEPSGRAAKPPDCNMPVLRHEPLRDFRKVAIVEALGNRYADEADVLPAVQRRACETGADAIVVLTSRAQTSEDATGYYIDSVAIVYGKENPTAAGTAYKIPRIPQGN
jgi:hypothetical protein